MHVLALTGRSDGRPTNIEITIDKKNLTSKDALLGIVIHGMIHSHSIEKGFSYQGVDKKNYPVFDFKTDPELNNPNTQLGKDWLIYRGTFPVFPNIDPSLTPGLKQHLDRNYPVGPNNNQRPQ